MKSTWGFVARGEDSERLEIDIYDSIGEGFWTEGITAKAVRQILQSSKNAKQIDLRVHSRGGDVADGFAIYNLLSEHSATVTAHIDSLAASMASVVVMAADEIHIASNAMVMIHNPWGGTEGESEDLRRHADLLDKMRQQIAEIYVSRTGSELEKVLEMMDAETWMTAKEAKALGFADHITSAKKGAAKAQAFAWLDLSDLRAPQKLTSAVAQARSWQAKHQPAKESNMSKETDDKAKADLEEKIEELEELVEELKEENKDLKSKAGKASKAAKGDLEEEIEKLKEEIEELKEENKALKGRSKGGSEEEKQAKARLSRIERLVGATGDGAVGAIRAMKEAREAHEALAAEVTTLKITNARREFDEAIRVGRMEKRNLNPALTKRYNDKFEAAVRDGGDVAEIVEDLKGFIAVAPSLYSSQRPADPRVSEEGALKWRGKTFAELKPMERSNLKAEDQELYALMRRDWENTR